MRPTLLIVPGLRDAVAEHWQTHLATQWPGAVTVEPMGREDLDCARRVQALEAAAQGIDGPLLLAAHSGGCLTVAHWARRTRRRVAAALLATPPDFETPLPAGYPDIEALRAAGWMPIPREPLPFRSLVAASRNDPLGRLDRVCELARAWGSEWEDLGDVGHLNPASGYGPWPAGLRLLERLARDVNR